MNIRKIKGFAKISARVCGTLVIILLAIQTAAVAIPYLMGLHAYAVLSGSMGNSVPYGCVVYVQKTSFEKLKPGDIATFDSAKDPDKRFTHRVISIDPKNKTIVTKGDANPTYDPVPASTDRLIGKVTCVIPLAGLPVALLENGTALIIVVILIAVWLAAEIEITLSKRKIKKVSK